MRLRPSRPDPEPLQTNDVLITAGGTVVWLLALVVLVVLQATGTHVHSWWLGMCGYGSGLGVLGVWFVSRRTRAINRGESA